MAPHVARIFPKSDPGAAETHENWLEAHRNLNMNNSKEHKKNTISRHSFDTF
jgi:hypothetical protein